MFFDSRRSIMFIANMTLHILHTRRLQISNIIFVRQHQQADNIVCRHNQMTTVNIPNNRIHNCIDI